MDWNAVSAIAGVLAAISVTLTVVYLAIQIKKNTIATHSQTYQLATSALAEMAAIIGRDKELARTVDRFGVLPVRRLLFTKLDESESFGCIINAHLRRKLPLSYFTTGQRVPEDIEAATAKRLLNLVLRSEA